MGLKSGGRVKGECGEEWADQWGKGRWLWGRLMLILINSNIIWGKITLKK